MHKDSPIPLAEILDGIGFRIELFRARHRRNILFVREVDSRYLRVEGSSDESTKQPHITVVDVKRAIGVGHGVGVVERHDTGVLQSIEEL